jgi:hypothetical protein
MGSHNKALASTFPLDHFIPHINLNVRTNSNSTTFFSAVAAVAYAILSLSLPTPLVLYKVADDCSKAFSSFFYLTTSTTTILHLCCQYNAPLVDTWKSPSSFLPFFHSSFSFFFIPTDARPLDATTVTAMQMASYKTQATAAIPQNTNRKNKTQDNFVIVSSLCCRRLFSSSSVALLSTTNTTAG